MIIIIKQFTISTFHCFCWHCAFQQHSVIYTLRLKHSKTSYDTLLKQCTQKMSLRLKDTEGHCSLIARFRSCWSILSKMDRSIFIIGSIWRWNWYSTHINLYAIILLDIIPICKIFAKTWHFLFCFGVNYSFWAFALTTHVGSALCICAMRKGAKNLYRMRSCWYRKNDMFTPWIKFRNRK